MATSRMPTCVAAALMLTAAAVAPGAVAPERSSPEPGLTNLAFMTGVWEGDWNGHQLEEHFAAPRNGTMIGMFRWCTEGRTRFTEHMVIEQRDDGVHLFLRHFNPGSVIWEQEADGPLRFRLARVTPRRAVFEAPDRAFPARIVYDGAQPDTLVVRLEGHDEDTGDPQEMVYTFHRVDRNANHRSDDMTTSTQTLTETGQSMGYNGGLTIALQVKDLAKSMAWYQDVVGFKVLYHLEEMAWCEMSTSVEKVAIGLSQVETPKVGGPTPTFGVKDIEHARKQLEDKRVRFDGPTQEIPGMVKLATFFDPDGNAFMLFESLSDEMP